MYCVLFCGWHQNGDGALAVWHENSWRPQHLYLTDSGHYMMRVDGFGAKALPSGGLSKTITSVSSKITQQKVNTAAFHADGTKESTAGFQ